MRVCSNLKEKKLTLTSGAGGLKLIQNWVGHTKQNKTLEMLGGSNAFGITLSYLKCKSLQRESVLQALCHFNVLVDIKGGTCHSSARDSSLLSLAETIKHFFFFHSRDKNIYMSKFISKVFLGNHSL